MPEDNPCHGVPAGITVFSGRLDDLIFSLSVSVVVMLLFEIRTTEMANVVEVKRLKIICSSSCDFSCSMEEEESLLSTGSGTEA